MTLQEALYISKLDDGNELTAIKIYAEQNDLLPQITELLMTLVKRNTYKLEEDLRLIKGYLSSPVNFYYIDYPFETASYLDFLTRKMQLGYEFDEHDKDFMKTIKLPITGPFWHDLAEAIKAVQDENYEPVYYNRYGGK